MPKDEVDPKSIPAVQEYMAANDALNNFLEQHADIFEEYRDMVEHVNDSMERADQEVRSQKVSCGPWDKYQSQTKYKAQELYEALGRDEFLRVGGKVQTETVYAVDKAKVNAAIQSGAINEDLAKEVKVVSPRYKAPKPISLP